MDETAVNALLADHWNIIAAGVTPLDGGMNSETWKVTDGRDRWVVKMVTRRDTQGFEAGLHAACILEAGGIPAGAPLPTTSGKLAVTEPTGTTALLRWVEGTELAGTGQDVELIGQTLAKAHALLSSADVPDAPPFDWIDEGAEHLDVAPWVRPAVAEARQEWAEVRHEVATWSFVHGDPAPEAFVHNRERGTCGIIDWAGGVYGPCLYDLASAAMYLGSNAMAELVEVYRKHGPIPDSELVTGLPTLLRLRYAVQADYFARRLHESNLTGLADEEGNVKGLKDARRMLAC